MSAPDPAKLPFELHAVVAMAENRAIGKDGTMPWHLPEDLKFFRKLTTGHPILMGRKTWESLGRPLPNRRNLVLSRQEGLTLPGAECIRNLDELTSLNPGSLVYVIGGAEIYRLLMPWTSVIYLTAVKCAPEADTFFPPFEDDFPTMTVIHKDAQCEWRKYERN